MRAGLVSITFRKFSPGEIAGFCREAGLELVEWGGDVHVPHGDLAAAREVRKLTQDAGLGIAAYGSYLRLGEPEPDISSVLDTASELGAPVVRVWAGKKGSRDAAAEDWDRVVRAGRLAAEAAAARGMRVACEFHGNTLTDTTASALRLLREVGHPAFRSLWQPPGGGSDAEALDSLREILPWLEHLHVFHWDPDFAHRRPLAEGAARWRKFLRAAAAAVPPPALLLEFLPGDDPAILPREASTLRQLISEASENPTE